MKVCDELATLEDERKVKYHLHGATSSSLGADLIVLVAFAFVVVDRFYIAVFPAFEQTHCPCM